MIPHFIPGTIFHDIDTLNIPGLGRGLIHIEVFFAAEQRMRTSRDFDMGPVFNLLKI